MVPNGETFYNTDLTQREGKPLSPEKVIMLNISLIHPLKVYLELENRTDFLVLGY